MLYGLTPSGAARRSRYASLRARSYSLYSKGVYSTLLASLGRAICYPRKCFTETDRQKHRLYVPVLRCSSFFQQKQRISLVDSLNIRVDNNTSVLQYAQRKQGVLQPILDPFLTLISKIAGSFLPRNRPIFAGKTFLLITLKGKKPETN